MATTKSEDKVTKSKAPQAISGAKKGAPEEAHPEVPPPPKAPTETLDLLEPKKKVKRRDADGGEIGRRAHSKNPGQASRQESRCRTAATA